LVKVFDQRFLWPLSLSKSHQKTLSKFSLTKKTLIVTTGFKKYLWITVLFGYLWFIFYIWNASVLIL
jgi:hypothetical protein